MKLDDSAKAKLREWLAVAISDRSGTVSRLHQLAGLVQKNGGFQPSPTTSLSQQGVRHLGAMRLFLLGADEMVPGSFDFVRELVQQRMAEGADPSVPMLTVEESKRYPAIALLIASGITAESYSGVDQVYREKYGPGAASDEVQFRALTELRELLQMTRTAWSPK